MGSSACAVVDQPTDRKTNNRPSNGPGEQSKAETFERSSVRDRSVPSDRSELLDTLQEERSQSPKRMPTAEDRAAKAMADEEARLAREIERQQRLAAGTERQIENLQKTRSELGVVDRMMGTTAAVDKDIEATRALGEKQSEQVKNLQNRLEELQRIREEAQQARERGRTLEAQGRVQEAREAYARADAAQGSFSDKSGMRMVVTTDEYLGAQREVRSRLDDAIHNADTAYTVAKTTQTVLVVAGAIVATGGVAGVAIAGAGVVAGSAVAIGAGTVAGTAIGALSATGEGASSVALGQKTVGEAVSDGLQQTAGYARDSVVASAGTLVGIGVGGKVAGAAIGRLEGVMSQGAARVATGALNGAAAGGANAAVSTTVAVTTEYVEARREFSTSIAGKGLTAEQEAQAYQRFMHERGLNAGQIVTRVGRDVGLGFVGGSVGGATGAVQQGMRTAGGKIVSEVAQGGADVGIGLAGAAIQGDLSAENVTNSVAGVFVGTATGRVAHKHARPIVNEVPAKLERVATTARTELAGDPTIRRVVDEMLHDQKHPMNVNGNLMHRGRQIAAIHALQDLGAAPRLGKDEFIAFVREPQNRDLPFIRDDHELSHEGMRRKTAIERDRLLAADDQLFSVGNAPSDAQVMRLRSYASKLSNETSPALRKTLSEVVGTVDVDGFPTVNVRAKSAEGIVDKIDRMREGNDGKDPRPSYILADMPDAVGGRITVRDVRELPELVRRFEQAFEGRIIEKDNFYTNPNKSEKPYRVITYTILQDGVPCEVQLTTLAASVAADLNHNTVYKEIIPVTDQEAAELTERWRGSTAAEIEQLRRRG
jgi:ppGpp synthetase/RelA/SpoT-type nucleotidyltranferase